jgi:hypothetical protein
MQDLILLLVGGREQEKRGEIAYFLREETLWNGSTRACGFKNCFTTANTWQAERGSSG